MLSQEQKIQGSPFLEEAIASCALDGETQCGTIEPKGKVVLILSGGLDSTTLLYDLIDRGYEVYALSFNYNQKHLKEVKMAEKTCKILSVPHKILNLEVLNEIAPSALTRKEIKVPDGDYKDENMKLTVVPNRNMVMLALATSYAIGIGAKKVFYGAHAGDHAIYPDCRKEFIDKMREVIKICDWFPVELEAPYWNMDKGQIVFKGHHLKVNYKNTVTCYKGLKKACGECGSCRERLEAFEKAGLRDPIEYER